MGYDSEGRWIGIDPNDPEDQAELHESHKRRMVDKYVDEQYKIAQQQHEANEIVAEILNEEGIDQATYRALINDSPDIAKEAFRSATRHIVRSVKKGSPLRDKKTGQFVKRDTPLDRREAVHHAADPDRLEALKETAKTRSLTDSESEEAIDALIGKLF